MMALTEILQPTLLAVMFKGTLVLVLGRGVALTGGGVAVGVVGALWLTRFLKGMLFGITPFDGWSYGVVVPLIVAVGLLATYLPARRAINFEPIAALREE